MLIQVLAEEPAIERRPASTVAICCVAVAVTIRRKVRSTKDATASSTGAVRCSAASAPRTSTSTLASESCTRQASFFRYRI